MSRLKRAWTFKLSGTAAAGVGGSGSLAANPIVQAGVVYLQDLDSNVYALALASGKLEWEYECNAPERSGPGPNGVAVVDGRVYGETPTSVFALSAATGRPIWVSDHVLRTGEGTFGIQPQVADGRVYLASQYGNGRDIGQFSDRDLRPHSARPGRRHQRNGTKPKSAAGGIRRAMRRSPPVAPRRPDPCLSVL